MLTLFAIILFVAWIVAVAASYTLGGWIHGLLVVAIILVLVRLMQGGGKNEETI
jgi:multisubunit Na+/H+ antiporter MnhE subunit